MNYNQFSTFLIHKNTFLCSLLSQHLNFSSSLNAIKTYCLYLLLHKKMSHCVWIWPHTYVHKVGFIYSCHSLFCSASRSGLTKFEFPPLNVFVFPVCCFGIANKYIWGLHVALFGLVFHSSPSPSSLLEELIAFRTACFKINPATTVLKNSILIWLQLSWSLQQHKLSVHK